MTENRTTEIIETPGGHKVEVYDYITGGEMRRMQRFFVEAMETGLSLDVDNPDQMQDQVKTSIKPSILMEAQEIAIDMLVVAVNGEKENAKENVRNLPPDDLDFVIQYLDDVTSGENDKKKSETQSQSTPATEE